MKMSDVFKLPMVQGSIVLMSNDHRYVIEFDASDSNAGDQIEHVAYAINNHDRMVEEIAELKGALKSLIGKGVDLLNVEDVIDEEDAASVHANFNDAIIKSEKLLAKLNQEGEE